MEKAAREEECHKKKKKKKDAKEKEAQDAKAQAEEERKKAEEHKEFLQMGKLRLAAIVGREKYEKECTELIAYWKNHITTMQRQSMNLDDHRTYLNSVWEDESLYPHGNVMSYIKLIQKLKESGRDQKAEAVQEVVDKGLNSYAANGVLTVHDLVIKPKWFIWVIQKADGTVMDCKDPHYGEDQKIGLHDLVSPPSMHHMDTTRRITVAGHSGPVHLDAGYCPFCAYHMGCHQTLNTHVWSHLRLSIFCEVGDCFFPTHDSKDMIQHAIMEHSASSQRS